MVEINGSQQKLLQGPKDEQHRQLAEEKLCELRKLFRQAPESNGARTADVIEAFLHWSRVNQAEDTHRLNKYYCQLFAEACGTVAAVELKPFHVTRWVDDKVAAGDWGETTVYNAKKAAFRVFSWAKQEGILPLNPLVGMKRPQPPPRQRAILPEEFAKLYDYAADAFRDYLLALRETGARPKEVRDLEWTQVEDDRWVLGKHKTRKSTGKLRIIILSDTMRQLMERLRKGATSKYVFLNCEGNKWTMNAVRLQVWRLKKKLGLSSDICAYLLRHGFGTQAILNGVDATTVAELMGHSSLEMVSKVYVHLADQHAHLKEAVEKISRPAPTPATDASRPARKRSRPVE